MKDDHRTGQLNCDAVVSALFIYLLIYLFTYVRTARQPAALSMNCDPGRLASMISLC